MQATKESLPAVTVAGVVAIIFGLFGALGSALGGFAMLFLPQLPARPNAPSMPPGIGVTAAAVMFFMFALAVFGIFVGVGVIRRRNWARIAMLIWGGLMAFFCLTAVAVSFIIFSVMPKLDLPNANTAEVSHVLQVMRIFFVLFYGIPAGVGIWWLVLFTRKNVTTAFMNPFPSALAMDPSGFPRPAVPAVALQQRKPACPLPLAILAGLFIFSGFSTILFMLIPIPFNFPLYLFGRVYFGTLPKLFLVSVSLVMGVSGVGILRLKPWALHTLLGLQGLFFINGLFAIVSPTFLADMREAIEKMSLQYSTFPVGNPFLSDSFLRPAMIFGLVFGALIIALLAFFRSRFLEAAAAAAGKA